MKNNFDLSYEVNFSLYMLRKYYVMKRAIFVMRKLMFCGHLKNTVTNHFWYILFLPGGENDLLRRSFHSIYNEKYPTMQGLRELALLVR